MVLIPDSRTNCLHGGGTDQTDGTPAKTTAGHPRPQDPSSLTDLARLLNQKIEFDTAHLVEIPQ